MLDFNWLGILGFLTGAVGVYFGFVNRRDALKFRTLDGPWVEAIGRGSYGSFRLITLRICNDPKGLWRLDKVTIADDVSARVGRVVETQADPVEGGDPLFDAQDWGASLVFGQGLGIGVIAIAPTSKSIALRVKLASKADGRLTMYTECRTPPL